MDDLDELLAGGGGFGQLADGKLLGKKMTDIEDVAAQKPARSKRPKAPGSHAVSQRVVQVTELPAFMHDADCVFSP